MSTWKIPIALTVAALAVGWLLVTGVARNDAYMAPVESFDAERAKRERVRVMGFVQEGSIHSETDRLVTTFSVRDEAGTVALAARHEGVLPDLFVDGAQVVLGGRLDENGTFVADDVMTKCPSKYEGAEEHPDNIPLGGATPIEETAALPEGEPSAL